MKGDEGRTIFFAILRFVVLIEVGHDAERFSGNMMLTQGQPRLRIISDNG